MPHSHVVNFQSRYVVPHIGAYHALGAHETFLLEPGVIYTVLRPYRNAIWARVQLTEETWYRLDGGDPAEYIGFSTGKRDQGGVMEPMRPAVDFIVSDNSIKLVTFVTNRPCWFNAQWMGFKDPDMVPPESLESAKTLTKLESQLEALITPEKKPFLSALADSLSFHLLR